jgi:hypothetical protein
MYYALLCARAACLAHIVCACGIRNPPLNHLSRPAGHLICAKDHPVHLFIRLPNLLLQIFIGRSLWNSSTVKGAGWQAGAASAARRGFGEAQVVADV